LWTITISLVRQAVLSCKSAVFGDCKTAQERYKFTVDAEEHAETGKSAIALADTLREAEECSRPFVARSMTTLWTSAQSSPC
jgi:hypothetical protein